MSIPSFVLELIISIPCLLIALSFHESAHAYSAYLLGDSTAKQLGRISLNPLKHLDPLGTILIIVAQFGWGKPVPVDPKYFKHPLRDQALVALAGPMSNLILALIVMTMLKHFPVNDFLVYGMKIFITTNLVLAIFNLLPIPPLDGSHILEFFLPQKYQASFDKIAKDSAFILLALVLADNFFHWGILSSFLFWGVNIIYNLLFSIT